MGASVRTLIVTVLVLAAVLLAVVVGGWLTVRTPDLDPVRLPSVSSA